MGTNYYATIGPTKCEACGRDFDRLHLGKSSMGWVFGFRWQPDHYRNFADFRAFVRRAEVRVQDEFGQEQDKETFLGMIESKQEAKLRHADVMARDYPIHVIDGYEFCDYEFS